ncbi:UDP-N-acetylglucosamine 1-carboxyvinyltransferase [Paenibacillus sp. N1-5-1-14]|uniref:UDP-N-acetylglucosamine 1-carboxyvinyltransferase n=1 Tax=Paenibacillus radicibacter TaxID=2972488 RepID=UPI002158E72E|nr:UDP-N-acetylglucosamine 1-carboxyvinyltransferase [Paenibacillus radicibacter]MCR8641836.1 UDP-N-acetylglucosamine 1-carboxyvinyltransferase [Paenibacillus radicibacter]
MKCLQIEQSLNLQGNVKIPGSKNSALALLAASFLTDEQVVLTGIPNIADFDVITSIASDLGAQMTRLDNEDVLIDPRSIYQTYIAPEKSLKVRTAYYFAGALLAKHGKVEIGYPGGDDFVSRPIDQHYKVFEAMGATFTLHKHTYVVEARELHGADIYFDMITSGATINAMLAAVRAKGRTTLRNAARDPEVVDTANLLNQMGAKVKGAGTDLIHIEGVSSLHGCSYTVIPDRLIAGALLISAGATGGSITVEDIIPEHLSSCLAKLIEIGVDIQTNDNSITASSTGKLRATRIRTGMYPSFATDLQQPMTALLTQAQGKSIVTDPIYPKRFSHVPQLMQLGADMKVRSGTAFIKGGIPLRGSHVHATDIRAGFCLLIAGLTAEGTTTISGVHHFERGYDSFVETFQSLGANLSMQPLAEEKQSLIRQYV